MNDIGSIVGVGIGDSAIYARFDIRWLSRESDVSIGGDVLKELFSC